jgi:hypothetical protein
MKSQALVSMGRGMIGGAMLTLGILACSPPTGSVSGKVTYKGQPLKGGYVAFINSSGGQTFSAPIQEDGSYQIPKITGGSYKVTVETESLKPQGETKGVPFKGVSKEGPPKDILPPKLNLPGNPADYGYKMATPGGQADRYVPIPRKYADPEQSGLKFDFRGGSQTYDINLSD